MNDWMQRGYEWNGERDATRSVDRLPGLDRGSSDAGPLPDRAEAAAAGSGWYYLSGKEARGPFPLDRLLEWLRYRALRPETLVWRSGMSDWQRAQAVPEIRPALPPDLPGETGSGRPAAAAVGERSATAPPAAGPEARPDGDRSATEFVEWSSRPRPWHRWFARMIDVLFAGVLAGILLELIDPGSPFWDSSMIAGVAVLAFWVIPEALILSSFGNTPGKALLNIRLRRADGRMLRFEEALRRSAYVWTAGLGLGIPLVSLVTLALSHGRLKRGRRTLWDEAGNYTVQHGPVGAGRILVIVFIGVLYVALAALGSAA